MSDGLRGPDDPRSGGGLRRAHQRSGRAGERRRRPQRERDDRRERCGSVGGCERHGRRAHAVRDRVAVLPGPGRAERPGARRAAHPHAAGLTTTDPAAEARASTRRSTALPRDPLQTNYEYADNLSFNPANFTPFASWVDAIAASVKAAPGKRHRLRGQRQLVHLPRGPGQERSCRTAFRGTASDAQLARYADFFTASVTAVGLPAATADLVDVTLTSPGYAFRDEVLTDASGLLLPAQRLQHITYTLADAPARGGRALVRDAGRLPRGRPSSRGRPSTGFSPRRRRATS